MRYFMKMLIVTLMIAMTILNILSPSFTYAQVEPDPSVIIQPPTPLPLPSPTPFVPDLSQMPSINQFVSPLSIVSSPSSPSPNQEVTIIAKTPTFDPNTAHYSWIMDGKKRNDLSGFGKNQFTMTTGDVGTKTRVSVRVLNPKGKILSASYVLYVTDLTMTWIAQTYTPKWYKGKALSTSNSSLIIVAVPTIIIDGITIPPEKLIYRWSVNGQKILTGIGQQSFTTTSPTKPFETIMYVVSIEDTGKRVKKEGRLGVTIVSPRAVMYQTLPLGGVEPRQAIRYAPLLSGKSIDVQMEPFFYPVASRRNLTFEWIMNGIKVPGNADNPYFLTITAPEAVNQDTLITGSIPGLGVFMPKVLTFLTIPKQ